MEILKLLASIRTPAMNAFFSAVTYLGDELAFMALALLIFWCVDKRTGYYCFVVGLFGTLANQFLKIVCRVPRPWVLDPSFTIVESARAAATGYSFPSGHTQNAVGTFGAIGLMTKNKAVKTVCFALCLLVPFSRMYLGVHTPMDVGVAFLMAAALLALLYPFFRAEEAAQRALRVLLPACLAAALGFLFYVTALRADSFSSEEDLSNLSHAVKNAWTLSGCMLGLGIVYLFDRHLRFSTRAPLPGQILKLTLGLALAVLIKSLLKAPLRAAFAQGPADAVRYFVLVVFAGVVWPLSFPFFSRLGKKEAA